MGICNIYLVTDIAERSSSDAAGAFSVTLRDDAAVETVSACSLDTIAQLGLYEGLVFATVKPLLVDFKRRAELDERVKVCPSDHCMNMRI
jgi:hypothetical protein